MIMKIFLHLKYKLIQNYVLMTHINRTVNMFSTTNITVAITYYYILTIITLPNMYPHLFESLIKSGEISWPIK